ncbi:COX15/CtaA family protein [Oceanibacterium hippocampi]|uniref:Heme A synthase n=1 Tax=Oceanibacterium hippocampi TaxID=745714 RepID=A0A1Y5SU24_9PROT|nr:COX15/CtaA family protein [Oceanibacterium hippocampi]SLN45178.1 Heme A synthase [Oceanibacterium hippocampi]
MSMNVISGVGAPPVRAATAAADRRIARWLFLVALLVFAMLVLGGVTRLTNSGLSMVEWRPVTGWLPPLGEQAWQEEFAKYRTSPEYRKVNAGMSLDAFKQIYAFEYGHRLLGRLIGLAFFLPFLWFLIRGQVARPLAVRLAGIFLLGGLQGGMGWFMVKSGLVDHPDVSHYRLTAHLALAIAILGALLWTAWGLIGRPAEDGDPSARRALAPLARLLLGLVFLQILLGGLVAGINAGLLYNEWPLMGDGLIPEDVWSLSPWYLNPLENHATVQFDHRLVAYLIAALAVWLWLRARRLDLPADLGLGLRLFWLTFALQFCLGIATLLAQVPVSLGALHQAGGALTFAAALYLVHRSRDAVGNVRGTAAPAGGPGPVRP